MRGRGAAAIRRQDDPERGTRARWTGAAGAGTNIVPGTRCRGCRFAQWRGAPGSNLEASGVLQQWLGAPASAGELKPAAPGAPSLARDAPKPFPRGGPACAGVLTSSSPARRSSSTIVATGLAPLAIATTPLRRGPSLRASAPLSRELRRAAVPGPLPGRCTRAFQPQHRRAEPPAKSSAPIVGSAALLWGRGVARRPWGGGPLCGSPRANQPRASQHACPRRPHHRRSRLGAEHGSRRHPVDFLRPHGRPEGHAEARARLCRERGDAQGRGARPHHGVPRGPLQEGEGAAAGRWPGGRRRGARALLPPRTSRWSPRRRFRAPCAARRSAELRGGARDGGGVPQRRKRGQSALRSIRRRRGGT